MPSVFRSRWLLGIVTLDEGIGITVNEPCGSNFHFSQLIVNVFVKFSQHEYQTKRKENKIPIPILLQRSLRFALVLPLSNRYPILEFSALSLTVAVPIANEKEDERNEMKWELMLIVCSRKKKAISNNIIRLLTVKRKYFRNCFCSPSRDIYCVVQPRLYFKMITNRGKKLQ